MTLADYLKAQKLSYAEFSAIIGAPGKDTVRRYANGKRIPTPEYMAKIVEATNGEVTANDFFGIAA